MLDFSTGRFVAALTAALFMGFASSVAGAQEMVFQTAVDPDKEFAGPGPDGLFGVGDDDDLSEFGINPNGSINYIFLDGIEIGGGAITEFLSAGEGSLTLDAVPFDVPTVVNDFDLEIVDGFTNAPLFDEKEVSPHELLFFGTGLYLFNYTNTLCGAGDTRDDCDAFVEVDVSGTGWLWQPGIDDPSTLPFVNATGFGVNFVPFLQYIETVVPEETTAITVASSNLITLTADNTRGSAADDVIGGTLVAVLVLYSTDPVPEEIDCPKKSKVCGKTLDLAGSDQLKIKGGETVEDDEFSLPVVLTKKKWAGIDSRGFLNYGSYKAKKKDRQVLLKYDRGDLGFIFNNLGGVTEPEVDKKSSVIDVKLNKKRTKVKKATMKSKSKGVVDENRTKVTYSVDLKGTVEAEDAP